MSAHNPSRKSPLLGRIWEHFGGLTGLASTNGKKDVAGGEGPRATKRRRMNEDSLDAEMVAVVGPLAKNPSEHHPRALRVEVLRIGRGYLPDPNANGLLQGNGSPLKKNLPIAVVRTRCRLAILEYKHRVETRPMYCESQPCELKIFRDPDGICRLARVHLQQPFQIDAEHLYVERDDQPGRRPADTYLITVEFESAGDGKWPPVDLLSSQAHNIASSATPRQWVISSRFLYSCANGRKGRETTPLHLKKHPGMEIDTDLVVETDLRWSVGAHQEKASPKEHTARKSDEKPLNGVLSPLSNGHVNGRAENLVNGHIHEDSENDDVGDEEEEEGGEEEAVTPSRSLRMRDKPQNYNLKLLSDKARGKELKERKKRKDAKNGGGVDVTYLLPNAHRLQVKDWLCVRCFAAHNTVGQLRAHLDQHAEWKFTTDLTANGVCRITVSTPGQGEPRADHTASFVDFSPNDDGNDSGKERLSGVPKREPDSDRAIGKGIFSRYQRPIKQKIPNNNQPMYDRLSKAVLKPLSEVDEPIIDNSWQLQKHRDVIRDYTDVHADEKEYISVWDAFAQTQRVSNAPFFQGVYLEFLEEKAAWLVASQNRMNEAFKHMFYLNARDALDKGTVRKGVSILRTARAQYSHAPSRTGQDSPKSERGTNKFGCAVCGQLQGPDQLTCANLSCDTPYYHKACVENDAKMAVDRRGWRCNDCYGDAQP
ncbi:hypothetical protein TruAng_007873 [Truncatella angustata]|nr:hypothetical protein TruAng_007873 [Truncatella angustata]